jgi:hypothetical protein
MVWPRVNYLEKYVTRSLRPRGGREGAGALNWELFLRKPYCSNIINYLSEIRSGPFPSHTYLQRPLKDDKKSMSRPIEANVILGDMFEG